MPDAVQPDFRLEGPLVKEMMLAIRQAGSFIRQEQQAFSRDKAELKSTNDLVSYVDRRAEQMLQESLGQLTPGCGFIMEESGLKDDDRDAVWVLDPLDGTTNFVYGVPMYSISAALRVGGETVLGFVYEINQNELFLAGKGQGAFMNERPIRTSTAESLADSLIATGFPFRKFGRVDEYMNMLRDFMLQSRGVRRLGSAAVDLAYTAMGRFDGFFETNLHAWDVAAGALIVKEAGGIVTDFYSGQDFVFGRTIVAASPRVHPHMLALIQRYAQ